MKGIQFAPAVRKGQRIRYKGLDKQFHTTKALSDRYLIEDDSLNRSHRVKVRIAGKDTYVFWDLWENAWNHFDEPATISLMGRNITGNRTVDHGDPFLTDAEWKAKIDAQRVPQV